MEKKFYLVWNRDTSRLPRIIHESYDSAKSEAERLARLHPDLTFYVLQAILEVVAKTPVVSTELL